jgi:RNA recognition motif-containing protein
LNRKLKATDKLINSFNSDNENINNSNLYIGNLSQSVTEDVLFSVFRKFGEIENIKIIRNDDKSLKNIAFVCFHIPGSALKAKQELNEIELCGLPIKIGYISYNKDGEKSIILLRSNQIKIHKIFLLDSQLL